MPGTHFAADTGMHTVALLMCAQATILRSSLSHLNMTADSLLLRSYHRFL